MNRLTEILLACLLASTAMPATPTSLPVAPNLLFILADDMGYSDARPTATLRFARDEDCWLNYLMSR
jgi:hypothetical protein